MTGFWGIIFMLITPLAIMAFFAIQSLFKKRTGNKSLDIPDIDIPGIEDF